MTGAPRLTTMLLTVKNMTDETAPKLERVLKLLSGVEKVMATPAADQIEIRYDADNQDVMTIIRELNRFGFTAGLS